MTDLNAAIDLSSPLSPFVILTGGAGVNDNGLIVANGIDSRTQVVHAYLLTPIPESPCKLIGAPGSKFSGFACVLPPNIHVQAVCDHPCSGSAVVWTLPLPINSDIPVSSALDRVSVTIAASNPGEARRAAAALQVIASLPLPAKVSGGASDPELIHRGNSSPYRARMVGPLLDVTAAIRNPREQQAAPTSAAQIIEIALPYDPGKNASRADVHIVTFDQSRGYWVEVGSQSFNASTDVITARVTTLGRFAIAMAMGPQHH
jgi:hypothetical protein